MSTWHIFQHHRASSDLTDAQRADHHKRRERILIDMGVVKDQPQGGRPAKNLENFSKYSTRAAADLGVSERTVRRDLRRGKNIAPDVLAEVSGPPSRVALFFLAVAYVAPCVAWSRRHPFAPVENAWEFFATWMRHAGPDPARQGSVTH